MNRSDISPLSAFVCFLKKKKKHLIPLNRSDSVRSGTIQTFFIFSFLICLFIFLRENFGFSLHTNTTTTITIIITKCIISQKTPSYQFLFHCSYPSQFLQTSQYQFLFHHPYPSKTHRNPLCYLTYPRQLTHTSMTELEHMRLFQKLHCTM